MPDDHKPHGAADCARIDIHEPFELRSWSHKLQVTHERLIAAVRKVGVMASDVEKELGRAC